MSFADAESDARIWLTEALGLLNRLRATAPKPPAPSDEIFKMQKGLWLVALYASLERGVNATVAATLDEISSHGTASVRIVPAMHSIVHYSMIQSVKDCGPHRVLDKSIALFQASHGSDPVNLTENPLEQYLQNVDGSTIEWVCTLFGTDSYSVPGPARGRLANLRERRNAVAHGRETASQVGERFDLEELGRLYDFVDAELVRFRLHMQAFSSGKIYIRAA